jgi:hypothetical protein
LQSLLTELSIVRQSTLALLKVFPLQLERLGTASNNISVRAISLFLLDIKSTIKKIFEERYL